jgi:hypothetical protein
VLLGELKVEGNVDGLIDDRVLGGKWRGVGDDDAWFTGDHG